MKIPVRPFAEHLTTLKAGRVLEIGGPSALWPYAIMAPHGVDGLNHEETIWHGKHTQGGSFGGMGEQHVGDALDPPESVKGRKYQMLLASHVLEHIANPLKALNVWRSLVAPGGYICLVLPKKELTFDHRRPITSFETLKDKFQRNVGEDDLSSLPEILELHDLEMDKPAGTPEQFKERSLKNFENRCLHHHVFDINLLIQVGLAMGFGIDMVYVQNHDQYIVYQVLQ